MVFYLQYSPDLVGVAVSAREWRYDQPPPRNRQPRNRQPRNRQPRNRQPRTQQLQSNKPSRHNINS